MRGPWTLSRYLAREVAAWSAVGLALVSVVFIGQNLLRYLSSFLLIGVDGSDVLRIMRAVVVISLAYTVPVSFLFGALAAVGRMAADAEVLAMRACGLGLRALALPLLALGLGVSGATAVLTLDVEHRAKRELRDTLMAMVASGTILEADKFTQAGSRVIYVEQRDRENRIWGVFVSDASNRARRMLVFAERGDFSFDPATQRARLRLYSGDIHFESELADAEHYRVSFERFDYAFEVPIDRELAFGRVRPKDMTNAELRGVIARARAGESLADLHESRVEEYEVQLARRYAVPAAAAIFGLLAAPLALRRARGARSWGALLAGLVAAGYYGLQSFCHFLALAGALPAALAMWLPNLLFGALALALLGRARRG